MKLLILSLILFMVNPPDHKPGTYECMDGQGNTWNEREDGKCYLADRRLPLYKDFELTSESTSTSGRLVTSDGGGPPLDLPAKSVVTLNSPANPPCHSEAWLKTHINWPILPVCTYVRYYCTDGRTLMTDERGERHCILLPAKKEN